MIVPAAIPSPSHNGFHIGPLYFHAYGIAYVVAVAAAVLISRARWRRLGGDPELPLEIAMWAFPGGLIGGRIYFDITTPGVMPHHWWGPFAIWDGGLGIWGGVLGGVLTGLWVARRRLTHAQVLQLMDVVGPALLVSQAIGRIGNYFNQELFGGPSNLPWALEIAPAHRPPGYAHFATFEPTFLYEMIWNLLLFGFLSWLWRRRAVRAPGLFWLYVAGYSGFRIFEETQRIDYSNYFLGMRVNFWIASALCLFALACFVLIQRGFRGWGAPAAEPAPPGTRYGPNPAHPPPSLSPGTRPAGTVAAAGAGSSAGAAAPATRRPPPPPPRKRSRRGR
ncbi:MAG TPA: prolipoprotein diacylglyceryl transferase [Solirubrobacteraceae bacterium]|nr:prolipoprotein diacylglyceryl transferase [Solirubrobacteraceae bacterium]